MPAELHCCLGGRAASGPRCRPEQAQRLFNCRRCNTLATVCTCCDRGQQYCSPVCRQQQRAQQLRHAGQRYQLSERGRLLHAARQRAYMATRSLSRTARPKAMPTDAGRALLRPLRAGRPPESARGSNRSTGALASFPGTEPCCCRCGTRSDLLLRRAFLRRRQR